VTNEQIDQLLHRPPSRWLERQLEHGCATCPITKNGVVRIMAQPAYPNAQPAALVDRLLGPGQITDAYLLALAASQGSCFSSFDQRISLDLVPSANADHPCLIPFA
jgi:predicted nucleic acid-binding protein